MLHQHPKSYRQNKCKNQLFRGCISERTQPLHSFVVFEDQPKERRMFLGKKFHEGLVLLRTFLNFTFLFASAFSHINLGFLSSFGCPLTNANNSFWHIGTPCFAIFSIWIYHFHFTLLCSNNTTSWVTSGFHRCPHNIGESC